MNDLKAFILSAIVTFMISESTWADEPDAQIQWLNEMTQHVTAWEFLKSWRDLAFSSGAVQQITTLESAATNLHPSIKRDAGIALADLREFQDAQTNLVLMRTKLKNASAVAEALKAKGEFLKALEAEQGANDENSTMQAVKRALDAKEKVRLDAERLLSLTLTGTLSCLTNSPESVDNDLARKRNALGLRLVVASAEPLHWALSNGPTYLSLVSKFKFDESFLTQPAKTGLNDLVHGFSKGMVVMRDLKTKLQQLNEEAEQAKARIKNDPLAKLKREEDPFWQVNEQMKADKPVLELAVKIKNELREAKELTDKGLRALETVLPAQQ